MGNADPNDPAVQAATKKREEEATSKDIGFGGTMVEDLGSSDAKGVGDGE